MIRKLALTAAAALTLSGGTALAAGGAGHVHDVDFSFEGPFGTFDQMQLQRGLQVYTEVCAGCHGLQYVPIRTLSDPGGPDYIGIHIEVNQRNLSGMFNIQDRLEISRVARIEPAGN